MLTSGQLSVMQAVKQNPETARSIMEWLNMGSSAFWSYNRVHSILRRLEDRGSVRRSVSDESHIKWELTALGRRQLKKEISWTL